MSRDISEGTTLRHSGCGCRSGNTFDAGGEAGAPRLVARRHGSAELRRNFPAGEGHEPSYGRQNSDRRIAKAITYLTKHGNRPMKILEGLPTPVDERLANIEAIVRRLDPAPAQQTD